MRGILSGLIIGILCLLWLSICEANETALSLHPEVSAPEESDGKTVFFSRSVSDRPERQMFLPRIVPRVATPTDKMELYKVELLLESYSLERSFRHYLMKPGDSNSFAEYMLMYATQKYASGRRRIVFGSVLLGLAVVCFAGAGIMTHIILKYDDKSNHENMGNLLPASAFLLGGGATGGGITLIVSGVRRKRTYGRWRNRLDALVYH
jgi:hypothetical protein